jgi:hypothetical protein
LEQHGGFRLVVGNAEHLKAVPGRKTDVKDAVWLARLLRHGLVRPSFIPEREQRELRELTRYRTALIRERASEINRMQKTLEAANIKLAAVISDVTGVSGRPSSRRWSTARTTRPSWSTWPTRRSRRSGRCSSRRWLGGSRRP